MKSIVKYPFILLICVQFIDAGHYIGDYYFSHPLTATWWEASRFCTFYGKQLIDVPDEREYRNILNAIDTTKQIDSSLNNISIWTSGIRFPDEKTYYWENSGMPIIYADWVPGDPNLRATEKCVFMWSGNKFKLADADCSSKCAFICRVYQSRSNCDSNHEVENRIPGTKSC